MGSHTEVQFPRLPRGGYSVVGDKNRQKLVLIRSVWPDRMPVFTSCCFLLAVQFVLSQISY